MLHDFFYWVVIFVASQLDIKVRVPGLTSSERYSDIQLALCVRRSVVLTVKLQTLFRLAKCNQPPDKSPWGCAERLGSESDGAQVRVPPEASPGSKKRIAAILLSKCQVCLLDPLTAVIWTPIGTWGRSTVDTGGRSCALDHARQQLTITRGAGGGGEHGAGGDGARVCLARILVNRSFPGSCTLS